MKVLIFRGDVVKAYQIKIQLEGLDVWRRVVMPAEVSFNALHHPQICGCADFQYQRRRQGGRSVLDEGGDALILRFDCLYHF